MTEDPKALVARLASRVERWSATGGYARVTVPLRELQAALAAIAATPPRWMPIGTAPKDGTPFMVWAPGYEWPEVIRWYSYDDETAEEVGEPGYWHYAEESMADSFDWEHQVTHWMTLPASPDVSVTEREERDG